MNNPLHKLKRKPTASAVNFIDGGGKQDGYVNVRLNAAENHLDIYIIGVIGWESSHRGLIEQLKDHSDVASITVYINSVGGYIGEGMGMINALRMHDADVTCVNVGYALSMGSLLLLAANEGKVQMASNSLIMIHRAQGGEWGDAAELRKEAEILEKHEKAMMVEYMRQTGKSQKAIQKLLDAETWFTAEEALEIGLIDEIIDPVEEDEADNMLTENVWKNLKESGLKNMPQTLTNRIHKRLNPTILRGAKAAAVPSSQPPSANTSGGDDGTNSHSQTQPTTEEIRAQALADEANRREDITAIFDAHGGVTGRYVDVAHVSLNDMSCNVDQARENLLEAIGKESPGAIGISSIEITQDEVDTRRELMTNSLLARSNVAASMPNNPYAFMRLSDIANACLGAIGQPVAGINPLQMISNAFMQTSSDFPIILDQMITEMVLVSYRKKANTWKQWCATGSVSDFREHKRLRLGSFGTLDDYQEGGEYKNKSIPDGEIEGVSIATKGNIISITREAIINDDLGYFSRMGAMLGSAAGRTIEADVYKLLLSNPVMADKHKLFSAEHKNILTGEQAAAMSEEVLNSMDLMMGSHKDISGKEELDISPSLLLVPNTMKMLARKWMNSTTLPGQDNSALTNGVAGLAEVLATAKLSGAGYYLLADATDVPTIEVNFLFGEEEPFLDNQTGWRTDGAEMKVRLDYGVDAVDYRGAVFNKGK